MAKLKEAKIDEDSRGAYAKLREVEGEVSARWEEENGNMQQRIAELEVLVARMRREQVAAMAKSEAEEQACVVVMQEIESKSESEEEDAEEDQLRREVKEELNMILEIMEGKIENQAPYKTKTFRDRYALKRNVKLY